MIGLLRALALTGGEWVIYILIAASVLAVAIMIERGIVLSRERKDFEKVRDLFFSKIHNREQLQNISEELGKLGGYTAKVLSSGLSQQIHGAESVEEQIASITTMERQKLEARMLVLGTLGNNAVYIGLFGTVLGVIKAFNDLAQSAGAGPEVVMQGLSEALIATAVGLMVALPCVISFNVYQKKIKDLLGETESLARLILVRLKSKS